MPRKVEALDGAVLINGALMPRGWALGLEQYAFDMRITRAELVRRTVADWLKKHPEFSSVEDAATARGSSFGQMMRQIMEDEVPRLCPPIPEYRGDGARHADAIRRGRASKKLGDIVSVPVTPLVRTVLGRISKAKPELFPDAAHVAAHILNKWALAQVEKQEGGGSTPPATRSAT
jgi:hypothetical protein